MSSSNQNSILAHRSIYGNQFQSSSSTTEYKFVSFKKGSPSSPRRMVIQKKSNESTYFNEKSRLLLEIANLRDEIAELNKVLDEKKKGYTNTELTSLFYFNKDKQPFDTESLYLETDTLDKKIENLNEIFDSDSISRLGESNENNKIELRKEKEKVENKNEQIQTIQDEIKKIQNSDIFRQISEQRNKISEKRQQIHNAVEIHRKLKKKLKKLEDYDPEKIKELEDSLLKAQETKKKMLEKYENIQKQQKDMIEAEAEKLRRSKKFVISTVTQSFEYCDTESNQDDSILKSVVSFEKLSNEIENENKSNSSSCSNSILNLKAKYVQENEIFIDTDFEIATQLLSETEEEEENNQNEMQIIVEEEENNQNEMQIIVEEEENNQNEMQTIVEEEEEHEESEKINSSKDDEIANNQKNIIKNVKEVGIQKEEEKSEHDDIKDDQAKVELVHNSIQCEINIEKNDEQENKNDVQDESVQKKDFQYQNENNISSLLFPIESDIESTSIVYSESGFSASQIEAFKKERKEQMEIFDYQISTETEFDDKFIEDYSYQYSNSDLSGKSVKKIDFQSETTSIYNSSIDSEKKIQNDSFSESTSIVTSTSDFKFTQGQESILNRDVNLSKAIQKKKINVVPFSSYIDHQINANTNLKKEKKGENNNNNNISTESSEMIILKPSNPISFESPEISSKPQISTVESEYTEYLSSQVSESEPNVEIKKAIENEKKSSSNSFVSDQVEKINSHKAQLSAIPTFLNKNILENQKNNLVEYTSSISSSRKKVANKIASNEYESSSSLHDVKVDHNYDYYSSSCQSAALMSAPDNLEYNVHSKKNKNDEIDVNNQKKKIPLLLSSRRSKKVSSQSDNNNVDSKFIAKDDRKILKIGSFSIKPLKKEIMPYFSHYGTIDQYNVQQENSKYFVYITFKKHNSAKNAKQRLNGSIISGTKLKISLESESVLQQNLPNSDFNFKCSKSRQSTKPKDTSIYNALMSSGGSS